MARYTVNEVLDRLWNESGNVDNISGDKFEESDKNDEDFMDESESTDRDAASSSEEEPDDKDYDGRESDNAMAGPPPKGQRNT